MNFRIICLLLLFSWNALSAQNKPEKGVTVEGITEYRLPNGLKVLLFSDPSKPTLTVNITFLVGSKHENYGETGMAHLLEHMLFLGTPSRPKIKEEITQRGNRWNGTNWYDRTNYFETMAANNENLEWAIAMEADRMVNSNIAKVDLDREMTVVRNEFESGDNSPFRNMLKRMFSTAFLWHNYGKSTIGSRSDIENVPIERLQAFYKKYYQPDNAVLTIAGKFDEQKALEYVAKYFAPIPKPDRVLSKSYTKEPAQDGERTAVIHRVGDVQMLGATYHIPAGSHSDYVGIDLTLRTLSDRANGRLHKALIDSKKASSLYGFTFPLEEPGMLVLMAEVLKDSSLENAQKTMVSVLDSLGKNPPHADEIERARAEALKEHEQLFNSSEDVCITLSEWIGMGDWRLFFLNRDRIKNVSVEQVQRIASTYLKPDNRTIGLFIPIKQPDRVEMPDAINVANLVADYKGGAAIAQGEVFDPSVSNILSRTTYATLPNGLKLAMLPKKTRGETVRLSLIFLNGNEQTLKNKASISSLTAGLLDKGTTKHTREQIKAELDRLQTTINIGGDGPALRVSLETTKPNLVPTLNLLREMLRESTLSAAELEKLKLEQITNWESQKSEPGSIGYIELDRHLHPYPKDDPRYTGTPDEAIAAIKAVTPEQVKQFYQEFYGASAGNLSIVGDFDIATIQPIIKQSFGDWVSTKPYTPLKDKIFPVAPLKKDIETPDKSNAFFFFGFEFPMDPNSPEFPAMEIGNYIFGGSGFQSRVLQRLREKEGLSYGAWSSFEDSPTQKIGQVNGGAIYNPQNAEKLQAAFKEEVDRIVKDGVSVDELKAAIATWKQERLVNDRAQDYALVRKMRQYLQWGRSLEWDQELEKKVSDLTPAQVNAVIKKYVSWDKMSVIKAGDFAKYNNLKKP